MVDTKCQKGHYFQTDKEFICSSCSMPTDKCSHGTFCREHAIKELKNQKEKLENEKNGIKTLECSKFFGKEACWENTIKQLEDLRNDLINKNVPNEEKKIMVGEFKGNLIKENNRCDHCQDKAITLLEILEKSI